MKCPKCGGKLVYETFSQLGKVYSILPDGTIGKRFKRIEYEDDASLDMVYCKGCGGNYNFSLQDHYSKVVIEGVKRKWQ